MRFSHVDTMTNLFFSKPMKIPSLPQEIDEWIKLRTGIYDDEVKLDALAKFWMTYGIHALPKEETNREVWAAQMEAWLEDPPTKEIDNNFSSYVEFFFKSDPSWVMWQYCNSYDDWCAKKGKKGSSAYSEIQVHWRYSSIGRQRGDEGLP
jgi:hypothetical protein